MLPANKYKTGMIFSPKKKEEERKETETGELYISKSSDWNLTFDKLS